MKSNSDIVREYFRCLDANMFSEVAGLFDTSGVMKMPGARPVVGPADIERRYAKVLPDSFSSHRAEIIRILEDGDMAAAILRVTATSADTNELHVFTAVDIFQFRDGKIASLEVLLDRKPFGR